MTFGEADAEFRCDLAIRLGTSGQNAEALSMLITATQLHPASVRAWHCMGVAQERLGRYADAVASYDRALSVNPGDAMVHTSRGNALWRSGDATEAIRAHNAALACQPRLPAALRNLAALFADRGDVGNAIMNYRAANESHPGAPSLASDWVYTACYDAGLSPKELLNLARDVSRRHFPSSPTVRSRRRAAPGGRLRVGYVSPDFREHTIRRLIQPILAAHDRNRFEVYCYSAVTQPDQATERLKQLAGVWRDISQLSDDAAAALVEQDQIDILVDLTGHMLGNRLPLLSRMPAPVQVQLGYAGTTGLNAIDYRITDPYSDPPGCNEGIYCEKLRRMPNCAWCYQPDEHSPDIVPLPARANGFITFGSLNRPLKFSDQTLDAWSAVLRGVPQSRLILLAGIEGSANYWLRDRLIRHGITPAQSELIGSRSRRQYMELFNRIDIAFDPFPCNGDTTTCDALWMGVPVITLVGDSFLSRRGASHLHQVGLDSLACRTVQELVAKAAALSLDLGTLEEIRRTLRPRMRTCPLTDGLNYTRALENAYQAMLI